MDYIFALGLVAGTLTSLAYLPQAVRVIRTKRTRDLSLLWLLVLAAGLSAWLVYGLLIGSLPLVLSNVVTLALVAVILAYKLG